MVSLPVGLSTLLLWSATLLISLSVAGTQEVYCVAQPPIDNERNLVIPLNGLAYLTCEIKATTSEWERDWYLDNPRLSSGEHREIEEFNISDVSCILRRTGGTCDRAIFQISPSTTDLDGNMTTGCMILKVGPGSTELVHGCAEYFTIRIRENPTDTARQISDIHETTDRSEKNTIYTMIGLGVQSVFIIILFIITWCCIVCSRPGKKSSISNSDMKKGRPGLEEDKRNKEPKTPVDLYARELEKATQYEDSSNTTIDSGISQPDPPTEGYCDPQPLESSSHRRSQNDIFEVNNESQSLLTMQPSLPVREHVSISVHKGPQNLSGYLTEMETNMTINSSQDEILQKHS